MKNVDSRTQELGENVKWIGTTVVGIATAIAGTTSVVRIVGAPEENLVACILLLVVSIVFIVAAAAACVWAVTTPEPNLHDLLPLLARGTTQSNSAERARKKLSRELARVGAVASFKYNDLSEVSSQLKGLAARRTRALGEAVKQGVATEGWKTEADQLDAALSSTYAELSDIAAELRLLRTSIRARIAVPLTVCAGLIAIAAMVPFTLLSEPVANAGPAQVVEATPVSFEFRGSPLSARSLDGCVPPRTGVATAVGGTWTTPILVFQATRTLGNCRQGQIWSWTPASDLEVVINPQ